MAVGRLGSINVLVVEDDAFVQKVISKILDYIGVASVVVTESGEEALEHLGTAASSIDIVICDIEMPGINGFEFTRRLRSGNLKRYKTVPILMLTAVDTDKNVRRGEIYKIDAFLVKPPTEEMLRNNMIQAPGLDSTW